MLEKSNHPDSGILQIIQMIEQYYPEVPYTIELEDENNLKYLSKASEANKLPLNCNNKYAAGKVLYSSTLDSIIAQSYYNDTLFEVLDKLIFGDDYSDETRVKENSRLNMIEIPEELGGNCTYDNFFYSCTKLTEDDYPVIPIAIYRASNPSVLGNESPYLITNPEKGTLLLTGDIVFVLGDSNAHKSERDLEHNKGIKMRNPYVEITAGLKVPNQELSEDVLESVDDEVILKLIKKELAGTEKERKKAKLHLKKKQKIEQYKKKQEESNKLTTGDSNSRPIEMQRSVSDVTRIILLDNKGKKNDNAVIEESKESTLKDELQDEELPDDSNDENTNKYEDEKRMQSSSEEDEKHVDSLNMFQAPKVIPPQSVEQNNESRDQEKHLVQDEEDNNEDSKESNEEQIDVNKDEQMNQRMVAKDEESQAEDEEENEVSNQYKFKVKYIDTSTNLLSFAKKDI